MRLADLHPVSLRFVDPALETAYRAAFARERGPQLRLGVVTLGVLWCLFGVVDQSVFPAQFPRLALIRYGVVFPLMLVAWPVVFLPRLRPLLERRAHELQLWLGFVATFGILAMGATTTHDGSSVKDLLVGSLGLLVTLTFLYGYSPMGFVYSLGLGLVATATGFFLLLRALEAPLVLWGTLAAFGVAVHGTGAYTARTLERFSREEFARRRALLLAHDESERLLANVLPAAIARRLRDDQGDLREERAALADRHDEVTVVFVDLVGFTPLAERLGTAELAALLSRLFAAFDDLAARHGVEKIKTLGDAWIGASGVPEARPDHAARSVALARDMVAAVDALKAETGLDLSIRVGVHSGSAIAGVIGRSRFAYDLWGDAVDGAKSMEAGGSPGRVRVSEATRALLDPARLGTEGPDASGRWFVSHARGPSDDTVHTT